MNINFSIDKISDNHTRVVTVFERRQIGVHFKHFSEAEYWESLSKHIINLIKRVNKLEKQYN